LAGLNRPCLGKNVADALCLGQKNGVVADAPSFDRVVADTLILNLKEGFIMFKTPDSLKSYVKYRCSEVEGKFYLIISFRRTDLFKVCKPSRKECFDYVKANEANVLKLVYAEIHKPKYKELIGA
jgi:hypothetical protein